ncbi:MAG: substrate-binding domain-containing protein [Alkalispirochaetaceae bacterium]
MATVSGPEGLASTADRLSGYSRAMHEAGLEPKIAVGDSQVGSGYHAVGRLMKRKEPPTAIFGANDLTALGVLHGAGSAGFAAIL